LAELNYSGSSPRGEFKRLVVIGGGAAGLFCAINAARINPFLRVTILEKSSKLLSKVKVSGGGRCNVTHACFDIAEMIKKYPRGGNFLKRNFYQFFTTDTIRWFKDRGVELKTEADGRMFPISDSSQTIIDCLIREVNKHGVEILMNAEVIGISREGENFTIQLRDGRSLAAEFVCIASGGYNKSSMFEWITKIGHTVEEPVPSLFTFNIPAHPITQLMGVTIQNAHVKIAGMKLAEQGPILITHWGLSGPAVLRLSAWGARELAKCKWEFTTVINWLEDLNENLLREKFHEFRIEIPSQKLMIRSIYGLPQRLWQFLCEQAGINENIRWGNLPSKIQNQLIKNLSNYELAVKGKTTFKEEFVTAGGVQLAEIDPNTMQSKIVPNLFFAGEVMNVDGITGGFNFQHAWTSGWISAKGITTVMSNSISSG
jgi:predicted Rossmann fold flavoprotein